MSYRRSLLTRWSRRDLLAILIIALGVAFLTGTVVLVGGIGAESTEMAAEYGTPSWVSYHDSVSEAHAAAGPNATILPLAEVTTHNGSRTLVIGRPESATSGPSVKLVGQDTGVTLGTLADGSTHRLQGEEGSIDVAVTPRSSGDLAVPDRWYVADASVVTDLGQTGALVVHPSTSTSEPGAGVPLRSVLLFFLLGTRDVVTTLGVVALGSGLLIGVVVWSVTRMSVRDRIRTIRVVRATGGSPRTILAIFSAKAALLTGVGVLLGYAIGIIAVNAAVNLAVFMGLPISIDVSLRPSTALLIGGLALATATIGPVAGFIAAFPASTREPAKLTESVAKRGRKTGSSNRLYESTGTYLAPSILPWRALVPTTATLTAFVTFVVLIAAMAGVVAPMTSSQGVTITEPGATHPIASSLSETHVQTLERRGIDSSGEFLLFQVSGGQPYLARGVNYSDYASITAVSITRGREPTGKDEAVIGEDLARTLGVNVGDRLPIGGSTQAGFDRLTIVGIFDAPGHYDDELLVSLPVARQLENDRPGTVQFVRADRLPDTVKQVDRGLYVGVIDAPETVREGETFDVRVTLHNVDSSRISRTLSIRFNDSVRTRRVTIGPNDRQTIRVELDAGDPGTKVLTVGDSRRTISVVSQDSIRVPYLPEVAPVGSQPVFVVRNPFGEPVSNATIIVGNQTVRTNQAGFAQIRLPETGSQRVIIRKDGQEIRRTISVKETAPRRAFVRMQVEPNPADIRTVPRVVVTLFNPWNTTVTQTLRISGPGLDTSLEVTVPPGDFRTLRWDLSRQAPGTYSVTATVDSGAASVSESYRVEGDDRIVAAMASGSRAGTSSIGRAAETAFGNLRFVLGVLLLLAGAMSIGGTTAGFAQAVQTRRRAIGIYRATGASPETILKLIVTDALRIGVVASISALALAGIGLAFIGRLGYLSVFGIRLTPSFTPEVILVTLAGALAVTVLSAALATWSLLRLPPWQLLIPESGSSRREQSNAAGDGGLG